MSYTCISCSDTFSLSEVSHYNINCESVPNDEQSLERNAQNPDYAAYVICHGCDEDRINAVISLTAFNSESVELTDGSVIIKSEEGVYFIKATKNSEIALLTDPHTIVDELFELARAK